MDAPEAHPRQGNVTPVGWQRPRVQQWRADRSAGHKSAVFRALLKLAVVVVLVVR